MPAIVRLSDVCSGHDCFPSRPNDTSSTNVFVEGLGIHRQSDHWSVHCCPNHGCHDSILATGSVTVFINSLGCGRIGDILECGSYAITGAVSVFSG